MTRVQPRRARFALLALIVTVVLLYSFWRTGDETAPWRAPDFTYDVPALFPIKSDGKPRLGDSITKIPSASKPSDSPSSSKSELPAEKPSPSKVSSAEPDQKSSDLKSATSKPSGPSPAASGVKAESASTSGSQTSEPAISSSVTEKPDSKSADTESTASKTTATTASDSKKTGSASLEKPKGKEAAPSPISTGKCIPYMSIQSLKKNPSTGQRQFPYARPEEECRTFKLPALEELIQRVKGVIKDPDLFRLFENTYPNTLDTMIKWRGYANATDPENPKMTLPQVTDEELTYVVTGDIDAMWLRDSASQVLSYFPLLEASNDPSSLASLWRGLINNHARYILISPYCHSFQPPPESGIPPSNNGAYSKNHPKPGYDPELVFDCKWELDSLASFLQISTKYYEKTEDLEFFQKYRWIQAVKAAVDAAGAMRLGTYAPDGKVEKSAWTFTGYTDRGSETLTNDGLGNPTKANGMVRTAFRPSDDACIYQLLVPANMMFAKYLEEASMIMEKLNGAEAQNLTTVMREFAFGIRKGIDRDAIVHHRRFGEIFAYEIDGYGGVNLMDDANIPSLLSIPMFDYPHSRFPLPDPEHGESKRDLEKITRNTRRFVLSRANPYFMKGPKFSAIGGAHVGLGKGWPMAAIVRAITAFDYWDKNAEKEALDLEKEVKQQLRMVLDSTAGTGVIHESVNAWNDGDWTRAWFGWANGLLGELILKMMEERKVYFAEYTWIDSAATQF